MASHKRICFCCQKEYEYCHTCNNHKAEPEWKMLFHDGNCKAAYDVWQAYRGKEIDNDTLLRTLRSMDLSKILAADTLVSKDFKKILSVQDAKEHEVEKISNDDSNKEEAKSNIEVDASENNDGAIDVKEESIEDKNAEPKKASANKKKK